MKVLVGGINQEANTFSSITVSYSEFRCYYGGELVEQLPQCNLLQGEGIEVIPAVFATIMPSAPLNEYEFKKYIKDFFDSYDSLVELDAIYLCLHGGMYVKGLGSGELYLLQQLRERYGKEIPIFASFDFHGNMFPQLAAELNYATAYKTAPHKDEVETGYRAVKALITSLKSGQIPSVKCVQLPMVFPGEMVITKDKPSNQILKSLEEIVEDGLALEVSWFCGFIWSDAKDIFMSVAVSALSFTEELKLRILKEVEKIWKVRYDFHYGTLAMKTQPAIDLALRMAEEKKLIFLSDSGDNVTAGTSGDNAYMLNEIKNHLDSLEEHKQYRILIAGIADENGVAICHKHKPGDTFDLEFGGSLDEKSSKFCGSFTLIRVGELMVNRTNKTVRYALLRSGCIEILMNEIRYEYTQLKHFYSGGIELREYDIICIKLGYLYPEFEEISLGSIIAFSPGNAEQEEERIPYTGEQKVFFPRNEVVFEPEIIW